MAQTRCDTGRCAVSSCGRGECRRRSSGRLTSCCRATGFATRRRSSTSTAYSGAAPRACSRSAAAWAKPRRRSLRRGRGEDFLGVEVHAPGVGSLLRRIEAAGLSNLRVIRHDAVDVVAHMIGAGSLAGIHVFFPDPWPKKRHHKRRLLQPGFVHALAERLQPGGYLHVATDWEDYAQQVLATLEAEALFANTAAGFAARPAYRPLTKFEARGMKLGHGVWDLVFRRT